MTDPIREALERLLELEQKHWGTSVWDDAIASARAALAESNMPEQGGGPTQDELWELWLRLNNELPDRPAAVAEFWEHAQINALAHRGRPAPTDYHGVLPMIISELGADDEPEIERIICSAISGGADYLNDMPREVSLERITAEGTFYARYLQGPLEVASLSNDRALADEGGATELAAKLHSLAHQNPLGVADPTIIRAADLLEQLSPQAQVPQPADVYFEFVVSDADCCTQAGGTAPTYAQALSEGQNYLAQYQQDGEHTLELRRVEVLPIPQEES